MAFHVNDHFQKTSPAMLRKAKKVLKALMLQCNKLSRRVWQVPSWSVDRRAGLPESIAFPGTAVESAIPACRIPNQNRHPRQSCACDLAFPASMP
jgi:hypothetical protein